ncbi:MAG: hypothetical protein IKU09_00920 [Firmicutes bacterium]|nr:hypothetical protein [Bacillota bacterium]
MAAPCCTSTVTPQMIRKGEMRIGDRIHLDEVLVSAPSVSSSAEQMPQDIPVSADFAGEGSQPEAVPAHSTMPSAWPQQHYTVPLTYEQMTPYMNMTHMSPGENSPMFTVPQTPMTTQEFQETVDSTDVQSYLGFMRTQLGRYMRIEQLMGSNNIEQRFGFLVGLGTNYIILQEITSGNIMVVDLFTIRLTYIYYSDPVVPPGVPY